MKDIMDFNQCHNILGLYFFLVAIKFYIYGATIFDTTTTIKFLSYAFIFFFDNISPIRPNISSICLLSFLFYTMSIFVIKTMECSLINLGTLAYLELLRYHYFFQFLHVIADLVDA